jgi:uncharacterized protein YkwD
MSRLGDKGANNHEGGSSVPQPRSLPASTLVAVLVALAAVCFFASHARPVSAGPNCDTTGAIDSQEFDFLRRINQYRAQHGLRPLVLSNGLNRAAAWKAQHMSDRDYLTHDDQGIGRTWSQRIRDCGYRYATYHGEILAGGDPDGASPFNIWHNSPDHDEQMLGDYRAIGIGRASNGGASPPYYWAVDFGGMVDARIAGGDVDCNGRVDSVDASLLLQRAAGFVVALDCEAEADADNDGSVGATDALLVLQHAAGLVD